MKKKLNETAVLNELRNSSVFFRNHSPVVSAKKTIKKKRFASPRKKRIDRKEPEKIKKERSNVPPDERTNERSFTDMERIKIRHTFDIFEDQLRSLHTLQLKAVQEGKKKPWRYRWPDEVRDEVLARLLALNAERAVEEARAGATDARLFE